MVSHYLWINPGPLAGDKKFSRTCLLCNFWAAPPTFLLCDLSSNSMELLGLLAFAHAVFSALSLLAHLVSSVHFQPCLLLIHLAPAEVGNALRTPLQGLITGSSAHTLRINHCLPHHAVLDGFPLGFGLDLRSGSGLYWVTLGERKSTFFKLSESQLLPWALSQILSHIVTYIVPFGQAILPPWVLVNSLVIWNYFPNMQFHSSAPCTQPLLPSSALYSISKCSVLHSSLGSNPMSIPLELGDLRKVT